MMNARVFTPLLILLALSTQAQEIESPAFGNNLITISPLSAYGSDQFGDVGLGLAYERFVNEKVSIYSPLSLGLSNQMAQVGAGLKLYPTGHERSVTYSISPIFLFTTGKDEYYYYEPFDSYGGTSSDRIFQLGFLLINSLNITIEDDIYLGVDGGFGVNYLNEWEDERNRFNDGPSLNGYFRVNLGYRF
ncbi:MAG: hypothetical protein HKN45_12020 [Flavobacteriales bacterium]|nr:hypothetical protein [Flavobacteriales bacterium]